MPSCLVKSICVAFALGASLATPVIAHAASERAPLRRVVAAEVEDASNARVIVKFRADSALMRPLAAARAAPAPQHAATLSKRLALPMADGRVLGNRTQALRARGLSSSQLAQRLATQPDVEWAVPDRRRHALAPPNDPYFGGGQVAVTPAVGQWYLRAPDATAVSAINAVGAWERTHGSPSVTVAVLDTGIRFDHPDLAGKLHPGYDFINDTATANDGGARDGDASDPGDWTSASECAADEPASSSSWHGTQAAGLIGAATDNGQGMASVGRNVMLLPVRVLGRCGGFDSDILAALRWAAGLANDPVVNANPARVINLSLGSVGACSAAYRDAMAELVGAGVTVVVAAGNDAGLAVNEPANCPGVIAVAGVRHAGTKVGYSNLGPEIAIAAPAGNCVNLTGTCLYPLLTTTNTGLTAPAANTYSSGEDATLGTSFATPLVAGTVALMLSVDPTLTPARIRSELRASARPFPATAAAAGVVACNAPSQVEQDECYCTTSTCGAGLLDAAAAVARVAPPPPAPPTVAVGASSSSVSAGSSVTLTALDATAFGGRSIAGYQWSIAAGSAPAGFIGDASGPNATLVTSGAGFVTVTVTVTDSGGATANASATITVQSASVVVTPGGSTGGGALDPGGVLGLAAALWALRRQRVRVR